MRIIIPPAGYFKACWEVCRKHDVLFIADEVVTAFGRLGHWFASEAVFGVVPDMITCAKGLTSGYLPLGACIISDRLLEDVRVRASADLMFNNGYTYSGHPVSCAAAITSQRHRIAVHGSHEHRFVNPAGFLFHIGCFAEAIGCAIVGPSSLEYPWFPGYAWRFALCGQCGRHLGWHFRSDGSEGFFGLILDRMRD